MSQSKGILAIKSGIWYAISHFLLKSIGFITTPIFTRILTLEEYGIYNNYTSWTSIMTIIISFDLAASLISAKYDFAENFDSYIFSVGVLEAISSCIWFISVNTFDKFFVNVFNLNITQINYMLIYVFFSSIFSLFQARERFLYKYKTNAVLSVVNAIGSTVLSLILVINMRDRLSGRIVGMLIPMAMIGSILAMYILKKGKVVNPRYWTYAICICLPYIPHALSLSLLNSMDRIMIDRICGAEDTALYSLAYTCGAMLTILISSLNGAYAPWLGDQLHDKNIKTIKKLSYIYVCIFVYAAIGIMLVTPEVLLIMGGQEYVNAKYVLAPVSLGVIFQFLYTMYVNLEQFEKKTVGMAIATAIAAGINYILNMLFIPKYGYIAAAYTTAASYLCLLALHMIIVHLLKMGAIYNSKFIILMVILMSAFTAIVNILYQNFYLRIAVILTYLFVAVFVVMHNKEKILDLLRQFKKK